MRDLVTYYAIRCLLIGAEALGKIAQKANDASRDLAVWAHDMTQVEAERHGVDPKAPKEERTTH